MASKSELQEFYRSVIKAALNVDSRIDDEGDVTFELPEHGSFYVLIDALEDPEYFMLVYPNFYAVTKENYLRALIASNTVNGKDKVVKLSYQEKNNAGSMKASAEMFIADHNEIPDKKLVAQIFRRTIGAIINGVKDFLHEMPKNADISEKQGSKRW
ncbi:MAG: hypothetical protein K9K38_05365 [Rhodoferax sp.]|nr:hypothetical protein [Rhodoferax sp.]MCF8208821.1 hypothetical protein [Rhodoferax sp.]